MPHQVTHQLGPLVVIVGRAAVGLPPEIRVGDGSEFLGYESEFDKGLYASGEHAVEDVIHILEVVDGLAVFVFAIDEHIVVEDPVKTDVLEAGVLVCRLKFFLPGGSERFVGASGTDDLAPKMHERFAGRCRVCLQRDCRVI
jgi:hypothetical protein